MKTENSTNYHRACDLAEQFPICSEGVACIIVFDSTAEKV